MFGVDVAEREKPKVPHRQSGVRLGSVWMDAETARMMAEANREQEEQLKKRRKDLEAAKRIGEKETIDVKGIIRTRYSDLSEKDIQSRLQDKETTERIEMEYYLDSPEWVKNEHTFWEWYSSLLG